MNTIPRIFSFLCIVILAVTLQTTHAASLIYNATLIPVPSGSSPAVGANVLFTGNSVFTAPDYSGNLVSSVLNNDTSNPFGLSALTFTYLISMDSSTLDPVSRFTISSFANYSTDASYTSTGTDIIPSSVNRSSAPGGVVRFSFDTAILGAGTTSALLVIQTDASSWAVTQAGLVDGVGTLANSLAPAPVATVPEPNQIIIAGAGLLALLILRRGNKNQCQPAALANK
jgi:hypothetical protein